MPTPHARAGAAPRDGAAAPGAGDVHDFYDTCWPWPWAPTCTPGYWADGCWADPAGDDAFGAAQERLTRQVICRLAVTRGQRVLDIGCGLGLPAIRLARATGAQVTGISTSSTCRARRPTSKPAGYCAPAGCWPSKTTTPVLAPAPKPPPWPMSCGGCSCSAPSSR